MLFSSPKTFLSSFPFSSFHLFSFVFFHYSVSSAFPLFISFPFLPLISYYQCCTPSLSLLFSFFFFIFILFRLLYFHPFLFLISFPFGLTFFPSSLPFFSLTFLPYQNLPFLPFSSILIYPLPSFICFPFLSSIFSFSSFVLSFYYSNPFLSSSIPLFLPFFPFYHFLIL